MARNQHAESGGVALGRSICTIGYAPASVFLFLHVISIIECALLLSPYLRYGMMDATACSDGIDCRRSS